MRSAPYKSEAFDLFHRQDSILIAERKEHRTDGIVTGVIVALLAFPLLTGGLILGMWFLILGVTGEGGFRLDPALSPASPLVARLIEAASPFVFGLLFSGVSAGVLFVFLKAMPNMFPYECRLKSTGTSWALQRRLWFMASTWSTLQADWRLWCCPVYMRGDWGYCFFVKSGRRVMRLASSGAYAPTKNKAHDDAAKDMATLIECFGVLGEFRKWEKA
ncbi:MAG: hypothetical protein H0X66_17650 [Verrucomicrobia bacterium]|nr:hypothetical protein [Verrucomicrobiota bacterium]